MLSPFRVISRIPISALSPNPMQPRAAFSAESIRSLAASLALHGQLSPILARRTGPRRYEIIAGERRTRAAEQLGWSEIDAIVVSAYDGDMGVLALVENVQREDLHYLEEAAACRGILDSEQMTQESLAERLGRSPSALANLLRLLKLPEDVRQILRESDLTERHARALLGERSPQKQLLLARRAAEERLTVRQLENLIARAPGTKPRILIRDERIALREVTDAVKRLQALGVPARQEVSETEREIRITVSIPRKSGPSD